MVYFSIITCGTFFNYYLQNEQFWKLYGINALTLSELAARAQGRRKQNVEPIN